jgi:hypothetical protein
MTDNDGLLRALGHIARRERRERIAHDIAVIKAAQKAGLLVKSAPIDGVQLELRAPEQAAQTTAPLTPLEEWRAKRRVRPA